MAKLKSSGVCVSSQSVADGSFFNQAGPSNSLAANQAQGPMSCPPANGLATMANACGLSTQGAQLEDQVVDEALASIPTGLTSLPAASLEAAQTAVAASARAAWQACLGVARRAAPVAAPAGTATAGQGGQCTTDGVTQDPPQVMANALDRYRGGPEQAVHSFGRGVQGPWTAALVTAELTTYAERNRRSLQAYGIQTNPNITLATGHVSGVRDEATPTHNVQDTVEGQDANRSAYENAPGGRAPLSNQVLNALEQLGRTYRFSVSELAGGSHSRNSRHYPGQAIDVNQINGRAVSASHPDVAAFKTALTNLGATLVLGPGDAGHSGHIHAQW